MLEKIRIQGKRLVSNHGREAVPPENEKQKLKSRRKGFDQGSNNIDVLTNPLLNHGQGHSSQN
jgi:hypothetical protein